MHVGGHSLVASVYRYSEVVMDQWMLILLTMMMMMTFCQTGC